jgi:drug/metabolite transporter (DMT)-like permease
MTVFVFSVVLLAAALHAGWNALVKGGSDKMMTTVLVTGSAAAIAMASLPFLPAPAPQSWLFIGLSTLVHFAYFTLVARAYHFADMSQAYPIMRGTAPLLVAATGIFLPGPRLPPSAWLGIGIICAGILGMAVHRRRAAGGNRIGLALLNAAVIACYTLIDGTGVRRSGAPAAYTLWIFLLTGVPFVACMLVTRGGAFRRYVAGNWPAGLLGGFGTAAAYGLVLWAMMSAPVAVVAALRETAILFGIAISGLVLQEKISPMRIAGACAIAAGAVVLRLA